MWFFQRHSQRPAADSGPTGGHRVPVAGADERQPVALRPVVLQGLGAHRAAQVVGQRQAHAHREHAGFFQRAVGERGHVARSKHARVAALQVGVGLDEPLGVQRQPGACEPGRASRLRGPDDVVRRQCVAVRCAQLAFCHLLDFGAGVQVDAALRQHPGEALAHTGVVGGHDLGIAGQQVQHEVVGVAAQSLQFVA